MKENMLNLLSSKDNGETVVIEGILLIKSYRLKSVIENGSLK